MKLKRWRIGFIVAVFALCAGIAAAQQSGAEERIDNDSDWWSVLRGPDENIKFQKREINGCNFQILGIALGEQLFPKAMAKFGKALTVSRGDASTGRDQLCYVSGSGKDKVYLIFETGEVNYTFYLFRDGEPWSGMDRCVASRLVSSQISTASGLHPGQTEPEVTAILGKPNSRCQFGNKCLRPNWKNSDRRILNCLRRTLKTTMPFTT